MAKSPTDILWPELPANSATLSGIGDILLLWHSWCVDAANFLSTRRSSPRSQASARPEPFSTTIVNVTQ